MSQVSSFPICSFTVVSVFLHSDFIFYSIWSWQAQSSNRTGGEEPTDAVVYLSLTTNKPEAASSASDVMIASVYTIENLVEHRALWSFNRNNDLGCVPQLWMTTRFSTTSRSLLFNIEAFILHSLMNINLCSLFCHLFHTYDSKEHIYDSGDI